MALDTPANQRAFPQSPDQKPGCGFPLVRLVVMFSLASGALLGFDTGPYLQSELALAAGLWALLEPGEVLLADRNFSSYRVLAGVVARQADAVCRLHASRRADLRFGQRRGPLDREVLWQRPKAGPPGMSARPWLALPATLTDRREPRALKRRPKRFARLNRPRALFVDPPRRSSRKKSEL